MVMELAAVGNYLSYRLVVSAVRHDPGYYIFVSHWSTVD